MENTEERFKLLQLIIVALNDARKACTEQIALATDELSERQLQELRAQIGDKIKTRTKEFHKLCDVLAGR